MQTRHCTRAVYTSPIKTISNQKYRDFGSTFEARPSKVTPSALRSSHARVCGLLLIDARHQYTALRAQVLSDNKI